MVCFDADDKATETRFAEIKLRAVTKIGELSRNLQTHSKRLLSERG
jgi:hypothetical protein